MGIKKRAGLAALSAITLLALAACSSTPPAGGESTPATEPGAGSGEWILGTTDKITSIDPAGAYDIGSWNLQYSLFEQLVAVPAGESTPVGDAAESCEYGDAQTITCTLRADNKFSNGNALTSSDVKFSFERNIAINDPNGASILLANLSDGAEAPKLKAGAIETPDDLTVVFHLNNPDLTFLSVISGAVASIVDEETFPADALLADADVIGSGPLQLDSFTKDQQAALGKNANYSGPRTAQSDQVFIQYFADASPLRQAIEAGDVDVAWRTLSPTDLTSLRTNSAVSVLDGEGAEFRYWVAQTKNEAPGKVAVRQAVANLIDRQAIATDVYDDQVNPAWSIVPPGFGGQIPSFQTKWGDAPNPDNAKKILADAGISTPVDITIGYTPTRYGPNAVDEANMLAEQLTNSGLFTVKIESAEWTEYQTLYKEGAYDFFQLGWYPDFLDADNYLAPFIVDGGFFQNGYSNPEVNDLVVKQQGETDTAAREAIIGQLQDIVATDVPLIPSWNGKNVAVSLPGVNGVAETLDATYIFRMWSISK
ncbi:MAG: ABC transporter substrate-binding protein [Propionicimonas sp.]